jgi:hypothetical protein
VKSRTRFMIAAIGGAALALAAAQGCSSPVAAPTANVDTIYATASLDGFVDNTGLAVTAGGGPYTGELATGTAEVSARQFYSFDISLPITAHLLSARLELYQAAVNNDPYNLLGNLLLDHVAYGGALTASAYNLAALSSAPITFSTIANHAVKVAMVTAWLQDDINNSRTRTQFRLRFPLEFSGLPYSNNVQFSDAELSCCTVGVPPRLIVSWQ